MKLTERRIACVKCGLEKPRTDFYVRVTGKRWDPTCKICRRDGRRIRYKAKASRVGSGLPSATPSASSALASQTSEIAFPPLTDLVAVEGPPGDLFAAAEEVSAIDFEGVDL